MVGRTILHYKILERLGKGGMGEVWKAEDTQLRRTVALKFLSSEAIGDEEIHARLIREAQASAALDHPNICHVYGIHEEKGETFIAMAYIDGPSLADKIKERPLPLDEALSIAIQIAEGLQEAHEKGIVHRDIKPHNVMLTAKGQVKIMDFGLAAVAGRSKLTKSGTTLGTPAYMSPEQLEGHDVDRRADIWALGCVLYELLTQRTPFDAEYEQAIAYGILNEQPEPVTAQRRGLPPRVDDLLGKALAKDPGARYQHADELLVDLRALTETPADARSSDRIRPGRVGRRQWVGVLAGLAALVALIGFAWNWPSWESPREAASVAVLPFANLSGDPENEYFSDGLAEEILYALTKVPNLQVAARTSAFVFREKEQDVREIGAKLNVDHVLEGSVRQSGERIRITAQLINVSNGYQVWSQQYERQMEEVFAIQDEISRAIVKNLRVQLTDGAPLVTPPTGNLEAYNLYLKGRFYWNKRTPEALARSKDYFEQAIALDSSYAPAFAGLGSCYYLQGFFGLLPPREAMPKAKIELLRALELDDSLAEAHAVMGCIRGMYEYDWLAAGEDFDRAMELDSTSSFVAERYAGFYLRPLKRLEEAEEVLRRAVAADPLSVSTQQFLGLVLMARAKSAEAIEQFQATIEMDPNYFPSHFLLAQAYGNEGMLGEAVAAAEKAFEISGGIDVTAGFLGWAYALAGRHIEARKLLEGLAETSKERYVAALPRVMIHMALGEMDEAFESLEQSISQRHLPTTFVNVEPMFQPLQSDPRYEALVRSMNLEP